MSSQDLTTFKALSFDVYGTLISYRDGMASSLSTFLLPHLPPSHRFQNDPKAAASRLDHLCRYYETNQPTMLRNNVVANALKDLAKEEGADVPDGEAGAFGMETGKWPPFGDTNAALAKLKRHYKLIALTNVNNASFKGTLEQFQQPAIFDAAYTAEDIGSYKPSHKNFQYLWREAKEDLGVDHEKGEMLHVARSLYADHVSCKELGYRSVWISREGKGEEETDEYKGRVAFEWEFGTLGEFAAEVERQFAAKAQE